MVAFLGLFMAMSLAAYGASRGRAQELRPHRLGRQLARACLDMGNNVCVVVALRHLTLTLFYILIFMAPMVIALLSAIFLREGLTWRKSLAAVAAGFAGVVIAVNPFGSAREWDWIGVGACLVCVVCFSVNMVWSRVLTRTETPESLALFSGVVTAAIGFALVLARLPNRTPPASNLAAGGGIDRHGSVLRARDIVLLHCGEAYLGGQCIAVPLHATDYGDAGFVPDLAHPAGGVCAGGRGTDFRFGAVYRGDGAERVAGRGAVDRRELMPIRIQIAVFRFWRAVPVAVPAIPQHRRICGCDNRGLRRVSPDSSC
jgi:hypothetical protein